jgi:predicted nucleic acid-binding protein
LVRALIDADTLYRRHVRNQLTWQALMGVFELCWSPRVLAETRAHLIERNVARFGEKRAGRVDVVLGTVTDALQGAGAGFEVPEEQVAEYERQMTNDPKDRHVLAAAVAVSATVVITGNTKDFARADTTPWGVRALTADEFLVEQLDVDTVDAVTAALGEQASFLGIDVPRLLALLGDATDKRQAYLPRFVAAYRVQSGIRRGS